MAYATWGDVKHFPAWEVPGFLYVLELSNGVVKVGRTFSPRSRIYNHLTVQRARGLRVMRIHVEPGLGEIEVVTRLQRIACRARAAREYFTGVSFGQAVNLVRQIAGRQLISV